MPYWWARPQKGVSGDDGHRAQEKLMAVIPSKVGHENYSPFAFGKPKYRQPRIMVSFVFFFLARSEFWRRCILEDCVWTSGWFLEQPFHAMSWPQQWTMCHIPFTKIFRLKDSENHAQITSGLLLNLPHYPISHLLRRFLCRDRGEFYRACPQRNVSDGATGKSECFSYGFLTWFLHETTGCSGASYWCLVGNGWEWGNGIIFDIYYGIIPSFPAFSTSKAFHFEQILLVKSLQGERKIDMILGKACRRTRQKRHHASVCFLENLLLRYPFRWVTWYSFFVMFPWWYLDVFGSTPISFNFVLVAHRFVTGDLGKKETDKLSPFVTALLGHGTGNEVEVPHQDFPLDG